MPVCHRCHQDKKKNPLYLLHLAIKAILILMGVKPGSTISATCAAPQLQATWNAKRWWWWGERRTNSVQIQTLGGRWPRLKHQKTTPKSPCGLAKDKWSAQAWWHRRGKKKKKIRLPCHTEWLNLIAPGVLVLIVKFLAARNARNFNKRERKKTAGKGSNWSITSCVLWHSKNDSFFFLSERARRRRR